jgi:tRNA dimethylallyltransferase
LEAGVDENKMDEFGLGYKIIQNYLNQKAIYGHSHILENVRMSVKDVDKKDLVDKITTAEWRYAKRQMTWFKRDQRIKWFRSKDKEKIFEEIEKFYLS